MVSYQLEPLVLFTVSIFSLAVSELASDVTVLSASSSS